VRGFEVVTRQLSLVSAVLCAAAVVLAYGLGSSYIRRLPHHAGYCLTPVDDAVVGRHVRPRHSFVIVVDGLSLSFADKFVSRQRLAREGQCRVMQVGPITVSRPVYAVLSTGLEQDRTGCRNNDETSPLAAESIWEISRRAGLKVHGVSALAWWEQLFPCGFDRYDILPIDDDPFSSVDTAGEPADLTLVHPLFVDHAGHEHGAASAEYAAAAERVDRQITSFLETIDLGQDLVVLTADHGHASYGGHGGPQPEIAEVLTCIAGRGVARASDVGRMQSRSLAPTLALLLGIPFPRHMRAVEDDLDVIFDIADTHALSREYLADRRAAIERFRSANSAALQSWLGDDAPASWTRFYEKKAREQQTKLAVGLLAIGLGLFARFRRRGGGVRRALGFIVWAAATVAVTLATYRAMRGSLDFTSINSRAEFIRVGAGVSLAVAILAMLVHWSIFRDGGRWVADELTLVAVVVAANLLHLFVYGWPLGFPLPGPGLLFFPFFAPLFLAVHATIGAIACAVDVARLARSREVSSTQ
jgi:hypothetical protein